MPGRPTVFSPLISLYSSLPLSFAPPSFPRSAPAFRQFLRSPVRSAVPSRHSGSEAQIPLAQHITIRRKKALKTIKPGVKCNLPESLTCCRHLYNQVNGSEKAWDGQRPQRQHHRSSLLEPGNSHGMRR
ncbi:unnamed protein product [Pleuronectes platessa]|uniref:Uncharacterized protein n=1 Tax=Pleuronectes platessa TaxID=8262 RepID=A0A9N7VCU1_PLEPL|nr:unnamed protein product [Pleuronectes platessa]